MTNQAKPTPGPWRVRGKTFNLQIAIVGPSGELSDSIAYAWGQNDEAEANARLIAAAPELMAVVERLIGGPHDAEAIADLLPDARAAARKAKGGAA